MFLDEEIMMITFISGELFHYALSNILSKVLTFTLVFLPMQKLSKTFPNFMRNTKFPKKYSSAGRTI